MLASSYISPKAVKGQPSTIQGRGLVAVAPAVELLCEADLTRLGICAPEQHGCGWLFLDRSRNGSRRWCTMGDCGTYVML